jgi:hypothetical protein
MIMGRTGYLLGADAILLAHLAFVGFVVAGFGLIWLGYFLRWRWVRDWRFRLAHLLAMGFVLAEALTGTRCFLTVWEARLREAAGENPYAETFMQHWAGRILFHYWPPEVFAALYAGFFTLVLLTFWMVRPRWRRDGTNG